MERKITFQNYIILSLLGRKSVLNQIKIGKKRPRLKKFV